MRVASVFMVEDKKERAEMVESLKERERGKKIGEI